MGRIRGNITMSAFQECTENEDSSDNDNFNIPTANLQENRTSSSLRHRNNSTANPQFKFRRRVDSKNASKESLKASRESLMDIDSPTISKQTQTYSKKNSFRINSLSNYLNWRLIDTCLKYQLVSQKDSDLLHMTLKKAYIKTRCPSVFAVRELKICFMLVLSSLAFSCVGYFVFGESFFTIDEVRMTATRSRLKGWQASSQTVSFLSLLPEEYHTPLQLSLIGLSVLLAACTVLYLLMLIFKFFYYLRLSYLVSTLIASLEHSKLCIKNAVQYLSDFSNVNSGFNFSHRGLASQVKIGAIEANVPLFRSLTEVLIMDILACQDSCSQLPRECVQLIDVHLCESVDVEKVITTLQDNPDGSDGTGNDHCSKLETIVQLHYELVTEFYLSIVLSLAHSFFSGNDNVTSDLFSVFKSFIVNYDLSIAQNLEKELDLVQDLFLGLDFEDEEVSVDSLSGRRKQSMSSESFERSNWKSVLTSFNIHLKEIAKLASEFKRQSETDERSLEIVTQRLIAAISCVENLQLLQRKKKKQVENEMELNGISAEGVTGGESRSEDVTTMERQYVANLKCDQFSSSRETTEDDVFLGKDALNEFNQMSSLGHGDNYGRVTFHPEEDQVTLQKRLMRSQREIMSELSSVMSHRVGEQKMRENEAIERKYGSEAVHDMGWDVTAAAFRVTAEEPCFNMSTLEASYRLPSKNDLSKLSNRSGKLCQHNENPGPSGDGETKVGESPSQKRGNGHFIGARLLQEAMSEEDVDLEITETERSPNLENLNSDVDLKSDNFNSQAQTFSSFSPTNTQTYDGTSLGDDVIGDEDDEEYEVDNTQKELMKKIMSHHLPLNLNEISISNSNTTEETFGSSSSSSSEAEMENTFSSEETSTNW
ncbi:uncharacterized protein LOC134841201 isoform X2 [Symsagittifera roscoffensis]|uniref:uncharacterized protein LOC134841201 isoform X2 n=1 Tax=Symsagittifera roscoffensis TaxID=84072 RepID=UPI00307B64E9